MLLIQTPHWIQFQISYALWGLKLKSKSVLHLQKMHLCLLKQDLFLPEFARLRHKAPSSFFARRCFCSLIVTLIPVYTTTSHRRQPQHTLIQRTVRLGAGGPARIVGHGAGDEVGPEIALLIEAQGTMQGVEQG